MADLLHETKSLESEGTVCSDVSGSTLLSSAQGYDKKGDVFGEYVSKPTNTKSGSDWPKRFGGAVHEKTKLVKQRVLVLKQSASDVFKSGRKSSLDALGYCGKAGAAGVMHCRNGITACLRLICQGLYLLFVAFGYCFVEFFFTALFVVAAVMLGLTVAVMKHQPTDPDDLKYSTSKRLHNIMGFCITMLVMIPIWTILFELCGRGASRGWGVLFFIETLIGGMWMYVGFAFAAGWSSGEHDPYPAGLRCTYGNSTPAPGVCEQVSAIRGLLITELVLVFVTFGAVGFAPFVNDSW